MGLLEESRNVVAQQGTVTPEQTMQGQLGTILDTESPLLKKARTRGMQAAQQRGLLNTSMGVEAAESAVLDVAVPIAQFDAGQMSDQAKLNQEWMNRFGQSRIQGGIDVGKIQETAEQQRQTAEQTYQQQIGAGGYSVGLIGSQAAVQSKLQEERAAQDLTAQTQSEAFQSAESAAEKEQQTAIQQSDIDARRESLASEIQSRAAMQGEQLTHDATLAEADRILRSELQAQSEAVQQSEAALQRENEIALQTERLAAQQGISIAEMENKLAMQGAQIAADESQYLADISSREGISENELANRLSLSVAEIASRENLSGEQIAHDAAMQEAKNTLETELQVSRIASQEGVSEAELQNRLNIQSADIAANSAEYIARIASAEGISSSEIASRLALNAADISSRELLEGRQITHDAAMQEAKKALETDLQVARIASQEGISAAELENRIAMQASDIAASEAEYTARIASTENISTKEIANRLALSAAEITSREGLAGNQITHEAALAKAKNVLEVDLQIARIASQKGISEAELQNRIDLQASQITATENQYLADIASRENISTADLANRLALNAADITSRELMAGNQITHEAAVAEAKNQLELDLQSVRNDAAIAQIKAGGVQDRAIETMRFLQDVGTDVVGFEGDVYLDATTGALTDVASYRPESPPNGLSESESVDWQRDNIDLAATADQVMADGEQTFGEKADELLADPESLQKMVAPLSMITLANGQTMAEYVGFNLSTQQTPNRDQLIHVYRYMDGLLDGPDADISPTLFRETENVQVGEGGKVGRMGMQFAQDLVKMDADTDNRMALSAADYASKTELSAVEHEQFLESLVTEYGLKGENQEFIDRAANYRAELAAETARLKVEAGLAEAAVKTMTSLEEVQMEQWVEINKMVFDPDDTVNDSAIRQQAIDAFNLEYADRKAFISNAVSELSSWEWSSSTAGTESGDGTDADSTGSDEPVGLLSSAPSVLYPSEVKPLGKLLSTAKNGNDSQFIQQIADGNDAEIFSSQIRLNGDIVNSIPGTTLYKESVGLTQSFLDTVKADNLSFGTVDDLLSTEGVSAVWSYSDKGWVSSVKDTPAFLKSLSGDIEDDRLYILFTDEGRIQVTGSSLKSGSITDAVVGSIEFWKPYLES